MQVIPALLENNSNALIKQINRLSPFFKTFQVDIADGIFVPNKTVRIKEINNFLTNNQYLITNNFIFDFYLMVKDYEKEIEKLSNLVSKKIMKINNIFVHFSLLPNYQLLITNYPNFSFGLVLNPEDNVDELKQKYDLNQIESIQIMSVNPGFQGQPFLPHTLKKIEQLRKQNYRHKILLDGAINQDTLPLILSKKYKPDCLCIGSYLTKAENLKERIKFLNKKLPPP